MTAGSSDARREGRTRLVLSGATTTGISTFSDNVYERITGRSVFVAFEHELAGPLGMTDWDCYRHGSYRYRADVLGGTTRYPNYKFHLSARDVGRIGQLYLDNGAWNGRQLLSPEWIARSTGASLADQSPGRATGYVRLLLVDSGTV